MVKIKNMGTTAFKQYIIDKEVYVYGAGRALESCIDIYFEQGGVAGIIDNNPLLAGTTINHNRFQYSIINQQMFVSEYSQKANKENVLIFISSPVYAAEIVEELDRLPQLDGVECFLQVLIRNTKETINSYEFTQGTMKIPKKIHYIWIGGKPLPDEYKRNIESWRKYNPDYEIIRWDENNYDFSKCRYMCEAYNAKAWGFVSNYARLDIIYNEGGIYLDTDVEVIRCLDILLNDAAFFNMGCADRVNMGCGFGAQRNNKIIQEMMFVFEKISFLNCKGIPQKRPYHAIIHPVLVKYGFEFVNQYQKKEEVVLYPTEVMSPLTIPGLDNFLSDKTVSIHQESGTWRNDQEKKNIENLNCIVKNRML